MVQIFDGEPINTDKLNAVVIQATAPTNPYTGQLWFDLTSELLKRYDGADFVAVSPLIDVQTFLASGTWTKPPVKSGSLVFIRQWGGGGGGAAGSDDNNANGGGGGGAYNELWIPASQLAATVAVTIGAGGTSGAANAAANAGGTTTFGSHLSAYGGGGGRSNSGAGAHGTGGSGGGALGVGNPGVTGMPPPVGGLPAQQHFYVYNGVGDIRYVHDHNVYGGARPAGNSTSVLDNDVQHSIFGGGAGGSAGWGPSGVGGSSMYGGGGGGSSASGNGTGNSGYDGGSSGTITAGGGGAAGTTSAGSPGSAGTSGIGTGRGGSGGGGGSGNGSGVGGNGGNGGAAGGGGGGAGSGSSTGSTGGTGGDGYCEVYTII